MTSVPKRPLKGWWTPEQTEAALAARKQAADDAQARLDPLANALRMSAVSLDEQLDAERIRDLDMASYAAIRRKAGLPEADPYSTAYSRYEPPAPSQQISPEAAVRAQYPPHSSEVLPDFGAMDMNTYAQLRSPLGIGQGRQYGKGIFDSAGTDAWAAAARAGTGRTALSVHNVQQPPRLDGRYLNHDEHRDHRTAAERFSNQANFWQR